MNNKYYIVRDAYHTVWGLGTNNCDAVTDARNHLKKAGESPDAVHELITHECTKGLYDYLKNKKRDKDAFFHPVIKSNDHSREKDSLNHPLQTAIDRTKEMMELIDSDYALGHPTTEKILQQILRNQVMIMDHLIDVSEEEDE